MTISEFLSLLEKVKKSGDGWTSLCPSHNDRERSLSIGDKNGRILLNCHAGCSFDSICAALGIEPKELFSDNSKTQLGQIIAVYDYRDEQSILLYQNVKYEPKDFRPRKPNGQGGFDYFLNGTRRVPYRLPELITENPSTVFLCEGEKDCDNVRALGLVASSFKNWKEEFNAFIKDTDVVLLIDHDKSGIKQANDAARIIQNVAKTIKVIDLYENEPLPEKHGKDVSDWLESGGTREDLERLIESVKLWNQESKAALSFVCLADVQPEEVSWLWHPYIPLKKLTLLDGEEGIGKSWLLCAIIARITHDERLPFTDEVVNGKVLMLSGSEDGLADTIRPRLDGVGADCRNVFAVDEPFSFDQKGLIKLSALIAEIEPLLVIIDPLFDYVTAKTDINTDNQGRAVTKPLREIAEKFGCAIVAVRHIGKSKGNGEARAAGLGGIGFRAAGRSGLLIGCDPQDRSKRAMVLTKSNLADVNAAKAVGFTIEGGQFYWLKESTLTAERILARLENEDEREEQNEAVAFLREALRDGSKSAQDIKCEAAKLGISEKRLRTARLHLKVQIDREGFGKGSKVIWSLPSILAHENTILAIDAHSQDVGKYGKYEETRASMDGKDEREVMFV